MNRDLNTLCFIKEQVSYPEDNINFGYKVHDKGDRFYVTFTSVLQSFDILNRNKRMYRSDNVWDCIANDEFIQDQLANNSWLGEMDHPQAELKNSELTNLRIANPHPGLTSHYIRSPRMEGNLLKANIQTDSGTEAGRNFAIKIVDGKIRPAFSARVLGEMDRSSGKPIVKVRRLITYDWVLYPSHKEARSEFVPSVVTECVNEAEKYANCQIIFFPELARMIAANERESQYVCESFNLSQGDIIGLTASGNSTVMCEGSNVYISPISDKIIRNKSKAALKDFLGGI